MTPLAQAQHFAGDPEWTWYILGYFFLAGLAGGSYFIAAFLRHWGTPADEPVARLGFYAALPPVLIAPVGQTSMQLACLQCLQTSDMSRKKAFSPPYTFSSAP